MFLTLLERSWSLAQHNIGTLFRTGWAYVLLLAAVNAAIGATFSPSAGFSTVSYMTEPVDAVDKGGLRLLAVLVNALLGFSIAIAYVRRILIDAHDFPLSIGKRTLNVILNQILLSLIGIAALVPLIIIALLLAAVTGGIGLFFLFAAPFISLMVVQKFSVILPAAAVDDPLTLKESWRATSGLGWAMAFAALVMSLLAGCLIGLWMLVLQAFNAVLPADPVMIQVGSALFPTGLILIGVWIFASLHATFYGLIRERFAARLGLTQTDYKTADARRLQAREKAEKALARVRRLRKP
ncbi:4-hydroxy-3-methylbut-2-en-1-yl diphosphate synthase [uncultured Roseibium sp.]|uniref:4-hydroxy-3-methylbut-2-en-1-yl diphosphate synthase n=1 Tax=uncultured Roseibium sp. TaxID=1936171 RepID=UPI00321805D3